MRSSHGVAVPRKRAGLVAYVSCIRYRDVLLLQGAPLLGLAFGVRGITVENAVITVGFALASILLVAHVFTFNDWAGIALDSNDPNKSADVFVTRGISQHGVAFFSLAFWPRACYSWRFCASRRCSSASRSRCSAHSIRIPHSTPRARP